MLNVLNFRFVAGLFLLLISLKSYSQKWEAGGFVGGTNYSGDLARRIVLGETNIAVGVLGKYNMSEYFAWRFGFNYGKVSGGDYNFSENQFRNLSFFSNIVEMDNRIEFNYRRFGTSARAKRSTGFVFLGINLFYFNPKARYNGTVVALQPLTTEGQMLTGKRPYSRVNVAVPFGIGYKYSVTDNLVLGFEFCMRRTFTDYLDDVSGKYPDFVALGAQKGSTAVALSDRSPEVSPNERLAAPGDFRGNPALKDKYMMAGVTITYRFTPILCMFSKY